MDAALQTVLLEPVPFERAEILRYAMLPGCAQAPGDLPLDECLKAAEGRIRCRAVWRRYRLKRTEAGLDLGFAVTGSKSLSERLWGCGELILMACTAGQEADRLIARARLKSAAHALVMHALGAQQVEGGCDALCLMLEELFPGRLTERFSPGYGDLPLALQRDIFTALQCERTIGVTLTDSLLMVPAKSVTAIIGIKEEENR